MISCHSLEARNAAWIGARRALRDLLMAGLRSWGESFEVVRARSTYFWGGQGTHNVILVVRLHLSSILVDERLETISFALDNELARAVKRGGREQDELGKGKKSVALCDLRGGLGLLDLLGHHLGSVEEVDLAVWETSAHHSSRDAEELRTRITGRHLGPLKAGNHGIHEMCSLWQSVSAAGLKAWRSNYLLVSQPGQPVFCSSKQFSLVYATELSINLEILLVEDLKDRVQKAGKRRVV